MIHEKIDMARWTQEFPLHTLWDEQRALYNEVYKKDKEDKEYTDAEDFLKKFQGKADFGAVIGPRNLAHIEQYRQEKLTGAERKKGIPTDVFAWNLGEAPRREMTKIGGLPYWPRERKWPCGKDGKPLVFAGQLCFSDSRDIVPELPGDILLLFAETYTYEGKIAGFDTNTVEVFWEKISDAPLLSESEIPVDNKFLLPLHGSIHRTMDYPEAKSLYCVYFGKSELDPDGWHTGGGMPWKINMLEGTKIGGHPAWIQNHERPKSRLLATFGSLPFIWWSEDPYTFLNVKRPCADWAKDDALKPYANKKYLCWDDCGIFYFYLRKSWLTGKIKTEFIFQSY